MTTTAHEDQFTVGTQTIERVRAPYDTASILRRNVADLELALRTQTELKEKAEAELAQARQQKPLTWGTSGELMDILKNPIYSSPAPVPVPVPAPAVPELDPMTRLIVSDPKQIKPKKQEPTVPSVVFMAHNKTSSILFAARKDADQYAASFGPAAGVSVTECAVIGSQSAPQAPAVPTNTIPEGDDFNGTTPHMIRCIESLVAMNDRGVLAPHGLCGHSRTLLLASANRLRQQQAHVVPAVPGEWRETLSKLVGIVESSTKFHGCDDVTKQARALLQSAPQASAVPAEWRKVMAELAADLQAACDAEHPHRDQYPSVMRKYNNDMEIVEKARALLQSSKDSHYISCSCTTSCRLA